jgi:cytochrome c553
MSLGSAVSVAQPAAALMPIELAGNPDRGEALAVTCAGCHGIRGSRNAYPSYHVPKLGGQQADYLEIALQGYRRGTRDHPTMQAQAASLSDQDIADLAAYFASLDGEPEAGKSDAGAVEIEEGRRKATACQQCHGENGVAATTQWPHLAGQHESYLEQSLRAYKTGARADVLMGPLVAPLDDATIRELAAYYAAQPLLHATQL